MMIHKPSGRLLMNRKHAKQIFGCAAYEKELLKSNFQFLNEEEAEEIKNAIKRNII